MNNFDKLRTIITLKREMIHHQNWEFCAFLRDLERSEFGDIRVDKSECLITNIRLVELAYIWQLFNDWSLSKESSNLEIRDGINVIFKDIIRGIRIDSILS